MKDEKITTKKPIIKTYRGIIQGVHIILENGEKISARPYCTHREAWQNRPGYFNVNYSNGWEWGIIFQAVFDDEQ